MLSAPLFAFQANPPFIEAHRERLGGKMVVEMTAWFSASRWGSRPAPEPHVTTLSYYKQLCPEASWCKARRRQL